MSVWRELKDCSRCLCGGEPERISRRCHGTFGHVLVFREDSLSLSLALLHPLEIRSSLNRAQNLYVASLRSTVQDTGQRRLHLSASSLGGGPWCGRSSSRACHATGRGHKNHLETPAAAATPEMLGSARLPDRHRRVNPRLDPW